MRKYSKRIALAFVVALFIICMATTAAIAGSGSVYDPWINAVNGEGSIRYVGQYKLKSTFHLNLDSVLTAKWQQDEPDNRYINNSGSESLSFQRGEKIVAAYVVQTFGVGGTIESGTLPSLLDACGTTLNGSRINNSNSKLWVDSRNSTTNALSGGTMLSDVTDIVRHNVCGTDGYTVDEDRNVTFTLSREYSWSVSTLNGLWWNSLHNQAGLELRDPSAPVCPECWDQTLAPLPASLTIITVLNPCHRHSSDSQHTGLLPPASHSGEGAPFLGSLPSVTN